MPRKVEEALQRLSAVVEPRERMRSVVSASEVEEDRRLVRDAIEELTKLREVEWIYNDLANS